MSNLYELSFFLSAFDCHINFFQGFNMYLSLLFILLDRTIISFSNLFHIYFVTLAKERGVTLIIYPILVCMIIDHYFNNFLFLLIC